MLQVDLLWVYAIGAMFATAAGKQLKKLDSLRKHLLRIATVLSVCNLRTRSHMAFVELPALGDNARMVEFG